jgi:hypothetical protein
MVSRYSAVAADTKVETPEGSMTIRGAAGQAIAVLSRDDHGHHIFRLMKDIEKAVEAAPVVKIVLENGRSFRLGGEQIVFKLGMQEARADELKAGDLLEPAFAFPAAYVYRDDNGTDAISSGGVAIRSVEPGGTADLYRLAVNQTGTFFLSAGVLCKADGT